MINQILNNYSIINNFNYVNNSTVNHNETFDFESDEKSSVERNEPSVDDIKSLMFKNSKTILAIKFLKPIWNKQMFISELFFI